MFMLILCLYRTLSLLPLSLHDALPICQARADVEVRVYTGAGELAAVATTDEAGKYLTPGLAPGCYKLLFRPGDRKSTRLNSSHPSISYAVFCLIKKIILTSAHPQRMQS